MKQSRDPARSALRKASARAGVTNRPGFLPGLDARLGAARRYHDLVATIVADQGGLDRMAQVRLSLVQRFAASAVLAEQMEAAVMNGRTIDVAEHCQLSSSLVRIASRIGLGRRARDLTPTLAKYLEGRPTPEEEDDNSPAD